MGKSLSVCLPEKIPGAKGAFRESFRCKVNSLSEIRAVNAAFLRSADLVDQREFEGTVTIRSRVEARSIDIVTESDIELFVVETGAEDDSVHQFAVVEAVGQTCPGADLECLVVAAAVAEQELEGVTYVHLPRRTLEEGHDTGYHTEFTAVHEFTARMEGEFGIQRNVLVFERLVGAVQVAECTAEVEVVVVAQYAEPQGACREVDEQEARVADHIRRKGRVEYAVAVVLLRPLEVRAVDAAVAEAYVGAQYEVVRFFAVATHFFGIRTRQTRLDRCELGSARFIAPQRTADTEVVVTAYRQFLVVGNGIRVVRIFLEDGSPLVPVVRYQTVVTVHNARQSRIQVERTLVELGKVYVLSLGGNGGQQDGAADRKV